MNKIADEIERLADIEADKYMKGMSLPDSYMVSILGAAFKTGFIRAFLLAKEYKG